MTAMAAPTDDSGEGTDLTSSAVSSTESDAGSDTDSDVESDTESSSESDSSDETSSNELSSDEMSSDEQTSSSGTSSKKPITSQGSGGGSTFIDESGSQIGQNNSSTTVSVPGNLIGTEQDDEEEEDDGNHFTGKTTFAATSIYKIIWLPILLIVLCVGGLVYVNVFVKKQYAIQKSSKKSKYSKSKANRRK